MLFDLHLAYFEDSGPTEKQRLNVGLIKSLRLTSGKIGNPFTVVTS